MRETPMPGVGRRMDPFTVLTLAVILVVYPLLYCSGFVGRLVPPIIRDGSRLHWWLFYLANFAFHWLPFGLVWLTLYRNAESWASLGVDWSWFRRSAVWLALVIGTLVAAAFVMPSVHYPDGLPRVSQTIFLAPVSSTERLFMILVAVTAGVTEEVLFRGFALTRLAGLLGSAWLGLPVAVVSFVFIHGVPQSTGQAISYVLAGLAFGVPFLLMRCRRLEWLILIHFLIDAALVFAP